MLAGSFTAVSVRRTRWRSHRNGCACQRPRAICLPTLPALSACPAGTTAHKAAPPTKAANATQLKQQPVAQRAGRDAPGAPSFAASAAAPSAARSSGGLFSGFSLKAAAEALKPSSSPSFAATPLWGRAREAAAAAAPSAQGAQAAAAAVAAGSTPAKKLSAAVTSNPLWRLAKLGSRAEPTAQVVEQPSSQQAQHALKSYAQLGKPPPAAAAKSPVGKKAVGAAAALLKYAKIK